MTVTEARKLLGKLAEKVTDEDLEKELKVANLLKVLFFDNYKVNIKVNNKK